MEPTTQVEELTIRLLTESGATSLRDLVDNYKRKPKFGNPDKLVALNVGDLMSLEVTTELGEAGKQVFLTRKSAEDIISLFSPKPCEGVSVEELESIIIKAVGTDCPEDVKPVLLKVATAIHHLISKGEK